MICHSVKAAERRGGLRGTGVLDRFARLAAYVERGESRPAHRKAMADHMATFDTAAPTHT